MGVAFLDATSTLGQVLADISDVVSNGMEWLSSAATTVTGSPLLLVGCCFGFIGTGIGLMKRLIG